MDRKVLTQHLTANGIVAIIRVDAGLDDILRTVEALLEGGLRSIEISMNTPGALNCLKAASERFAGTDLLLGVGTVLDAGTVRASIQAGAHYIVSPVTLQEVIDAAHALDKPVLPGALTPTEMFQAWRMGGDLIKVFPGTLGGLAYIKAVRAPLPDIPLVPTGGFLVENLKDFFDAGVSAVGIGASLVSQTLIEARDFNGIKACARRFAHALKTARTS